MDLKLVPPIESLEFSVSLSKPSAIRQTGHSSEMEDNPSSDLPSFNLNLNLPVNSVVNGKTGLKIRSISGEKYFELKIKQKHGILFLSFTDVAETKSSKVERSTLLRSVKNVDPRLLLKDCFESSEDRNDDLASQPTDGSTVTCSSLAKLNLTDGRIRDHTSGTWLFQTLLKDQLEQINFETSNLGVLAEFVGDCDKFVMNMLKRHIQNLATQVTCLKNVVEAYEAETSHYDSLLEHNHKLLKDPVLHPLDPSEGTGRPAVSTSSTGDIKEDAIFQSETRTDARSYAKVVADPKKAASSVSPLLNLANPTIRNSLALQTWLIEKDVTESEQVVAGLPEEAESGLSENGLVTTSEQNALGRSKSSQDASDDLLRYSSSHSVTSTAMSSSFESPDASVKIEENVFKTRLDEGFKTVTYRRRKRNLKSISSKMEFQIDSRVSSSRESDQTSVKNPEDVKETILKPTSVEHSTTIAIRKSDEDFEKYFENVAKSEIIYSTSGRTQTNPKGTPGQSSTKYSKKITKRAIISGTSKTTRSNPPSQTLAKHLNKKEITKKGNIPTNPSGEDFKISPKIESSNQASKDLKAIALKKDAPPLCSAGGSKTQLGSNHSLNKAKNTQKAIISVPASRIPLKVSKIDSQQLSREERPGLEGKRYASSTRNHCGHVSHLRKSSSILKCNSRSLPSICTSQKVSAILDPGPSKTLDKLDKPPSGANEDADKGDSKELSTKDFLSESIHMQSRSLSLMSLHKCKPADVSADHDSMVIKVNSVPSFFKYVHTGTHKHLSRNPPTSKGAYPISDFQYWGKAISRETAKQASLNSMESVFISLKGISFPGFFGDIELKVKGLPRTSPKY